MGDWQLSVVELTIGEDEARERVESVKDWLLAAEVIARPARPVESYWLPYVGGPRASEVCVDDDPARTGARFDTSWKHSAHDCGGAYQQPECPRCGTALATDTHMDFVGRWWKSRDEPTVTCESCGDHALLGDWSGVYVVLVGRAAVVFENWPELKPEFLAVVGDRLGPRWRIVVARR